MVAHNSYGEAIEIYEELVGISLSKTTAWEKVQKRGQKLRETQMIGAEEAALPNVQEIVPGRSLEAVNKGPQWTARLCTFWEKNGKKLK